MGCDVLIAVLPMSTDKYSIKTVYAVILTRHGLVTGDLANSVLFYNTIEEAEARAKATLEEQKYNLLRFAVAIIPVDISGCEVQSIHLFPTDYGVTAKLGNDAKFNDLFTSTTTQK